MTEKLVQTTLGPLPLGKLGRINSHEHIFVDHGQGAYKEPDFKLDSVEAATKDVAAWRDAGGGAMVDTMPPGAGRNVDKCIEVSQATGVPIILPTGFHKNYYYFPDHWRYSYDEEEMFDLILAECVEGVDRRNYLGPLVKRSPVKAGTMKVADYYNRIEANMKKCVRVVGRVYQKTGVPVYVHTEATPPFEMLDLLADAGVKPQSILVCHMDRNPDFWLHKKIAARGVFMEYDTPSRFKYQPECEAVNLMRQMIEAGYGDRITLGGDLARRSYLPGYGGGPGYKYLLDTFTPRLLDEGFTQKEVDAFWIDNPGRWLTNGF
jgi:phosphotriesterase-related protein